MVSELVEFHPIVQLTLINPILIKIGNTQKINDNWKRKQELEPIKGTNQINLSRPSSLFLVSLCNWIRNRDRRMKNTNNDR